jgi:S-DNA-T family DNA segregation ATPase FtsK/SpoIIIE
MEGREDAAEHEDRTASPLPAGVDVGGAPATGPPDDEPYQLPDVELLPTGRVAAGNKRALDQMTRALEHTLRQFNVNATVERVRRGPTVTRFELELGEGVRVNAVTKLSDDLAYALATPEIRIVAPIPGKSAIGIEVPNRERDLITLGDMLRSEEARADAHPLTVGLGIDIGGGYVMANLAKMPHVLIAGATGSGKSVLMNAIVTSVLMRAPPSQVQMVLIDPKRVELNHYAGVPHLLGQVITEPKRASEALDWVVTEMEQRYEMLSEQGYRNIEAWNAAVDRGDLDAPADGTRLSAEKAAATARGDAWRPPRLRYVLVVIDELADLMMVAPRDIEGAIVRISQMARAVGIHLVVATQRPEVQVVTGLIKANVPSRIALSMATGHDSKTVLNAYGAEKLVGDGDMLLQHANASKPHRLQGCFVAEDEIERVVGHWKQQGGPQDVPDLIKSGEDALLSDAADGTADEGDLTRAAMELVVRSGLGSTSMLQRKLKVGFARAGRLMDDLEELGVVGPSEGPKPRQVLMTPEELDSRRDGAASAGATGSAGQTGSAGER